MRFTQRTSFTAEGIYHAVKARIKGRKMLALDGGVPAITKLPPWRRYRAKFEGWAVRNFMNDVVDGKTELSGYLAGDHRPGREVARLEEAWANKFGVKHAIACNSATSGLLAACVAVTRMQTRFNVPALTMSATEYAPKFLGHETRRCDVDDWLCALPPQHSKSGFSIVTHLFGHPVQMDKWEGHVVIEDAAQAVLATEEGKYVGTLGDVGVFSLNYHKQLSAGEGGMVVTDNQICATHIRDVINHGECRDPHWIVPFGGLNLRMTELTAVIARQQLLTSDALIASRRRLRDNLVKAIPGPLFYPIKDRKNCESACYCLGVLLPTTGYRDFAAKALLAEGMPISAGYGNNHVYSDFFGTPHAADLNSRLLVIELCGFDAGPKEIEMIATAFDKVARVL